MAAAAKLLNLNLRFTMQSQLQSNWCWAATSTSTSLFYNPRSTWTQCKVVNAELNQTSCCKKGNSSQCNVPWYLDRALTRTANFGSMIAGPLSLKALRKEIEAKRPVGVRIGWKAGGGHFVVIDGISDRGKEETISVRDPIYGSSSYSFTAFSKSYQGTGQWTHTYKTQK